ncbi:MAG: 6-aminohexanoate hydrolase [Verrucomicrobia bacterium]|nr:MAG: 6-aminohexanoate hydrolase [Verrucomicrobiota bacterium]
MSTLRCVLLGVSIALVGLPNLPVDGQTHDPNPIVGLWAAEQVVALPVRGELTINGRKPEWTATISGLAAPIQRNKDVIAFTLANDAGEFRGRVIDPKTIVGHWIQPANEINNNRYATPIRLAANDKVWKGKVEPLDARLSLYMSIFRVPDRSIRAIIRNPEFNLFRRNIYRVDESNGALTFSDTKNSEQKFQGTFDEKAGRVSVRLPNIDKEVQFTRQKPEEAVGFFPRTWRAKIAADRKPIAEDDGWATASLSEVGLNAPPLFDLIEKILSVDPTDNPLNIQSLLIARHGKLVFEEYFYGFNKERPHDMRSASKTFAPLLVGIARDRGAKIDIDTPVYSQFPEYKEFANPDSRKLKMTVRDLITMTSGLACDDNDESSPGNEDNMQQQKAQPDWYKYTLDLPMVRDPGGDHAVYCSAGINLLGGIVRNATHEWLPEFFYENVAKQLQIKTYHWNLMPSGDGYVGGGLYLRPRDQLKLGQLYLDGGEWNRHRVVSKDWVERSTSRQSTFGPTLGADHDYGYGWHLYHFDVGNRTFQAYAAGGNGGQIVMVIPDLDLVVGFTGGAYGEFAKWYKWQLELVPQFIIPAATTKRSE